MTDLMTVENLAQYLSLRQFPTGQGWITRLEDAATRYLRMGTVITPADLGTARQYCRGEIIEVEGAGPDDWVFVVQPFEDVRLLFKYTRDEEFGNTLNFYIHQAARGQVATEDLAFLLDFYMQILGQRHLLYTLTGIVPEQQFSITRFPKMEIPIEDIQRIYFSLSQLAQLLDSTQKLERAAAFTKGSLDREIGMECLCRAISIQPTLNVSLRFEFPLDHSIPPQVTASDALVYMPSNLVLYLVAAYANAFARAVGSQYRVNFHGLCHYFHVTKFE